MQEGRYNKKFWEELIAYFTLIRTDRIENDASNSSSLPQERVYRIADGPQIFLQYDTDRIENDASNNSFIGDCICCAGTCLPSRCQVTIGGYTYRHRLMGGSYEVRRWDDTCTKFNKYWFRHSEVNRAIHRHTARWFHKVKKVKKWSCPCT
jgi:hypothetical protein